MLGAFRDSAFPKSPLNLTTPGYLGRAAPKQMQSIKMCLTVRGEWANLINLPSRETALWKAVWEEKFDELLLVQILTPNVVNYVP